MVEDTWGKAKRNGRRTGRNYHEIAAFHHKVKADTYAQVGFGKKAASHRRRAEWHAAFGEPGGPPPPPQASGAAEAKKAERLLREAEVRAFDAQYTKRISSDYESAIAAIKKITDREIEVANVPNEQKKTKNPIERESGTIRGYVEAAAKSTTPLKSFRALKDAHVSGTYDDSEEAAAVGVGRGARGARGARSAEPEMTQRKMGNPLEYEPGRVEANAKAAQRSLNTLGESVVVYLRALGDKRGREGYRASHELVGSLIGRLSREWKKMRANVEEQAKMSIGDSGGYVESQEPDYVLDVLKPTLDALKHGERTLRGIEARYLTVRA